MISPSFEYSQRPFLYYYKNSRFISRKVQVGKVTIGGENTPIAIQSMTTSDTMDTQATANQAMALFDAGADLVRITAPGPKDAENLANIKAELQSKGYELPLVADIHFSPKAAMIALEHVEKVRINPGNFADQKRFKIQTYTDATYQEELERVAEVFLPLVRRAKQYKRALRIGANHGSLSDRIMNRYGDTPLGMVESAMEFIRLAAQENFHDIVVSMKSSNPQVMVQAYRLLVKHFTQENLAYPLHIGLTEAGSGNDGRMKSAIGIGALLMDGIGDTIRVSLTENPVEEIPAARKILASLPQSQVQIKLKANPSVNKAKLVAAYQDQVSFYEYKRLKSKALSLGNCYIGDKNRQSIFLPITCPNTNDKAALSEKQVWGQQLIELKNKGCDALWLKASELNQTPKLWFQAISTAKLDWIQDIETLPLYDTEEAIATQIHPQASAISIGIDETSLQDTNTSKQIKQLYEYLTKQQAQPGLILNLLIDHPKPELHTEHFFTHYAKLFQTLADLLDSLGSEKNRNKLGLCLSLKQAVTTKESISQQSYSARLLCLYRLLVASNQGKFPLVLKASYADTKTALYPASIHIGPLLLDGIGDVLCLNLESSQTNKEKLEFHLDLLQATRLRLSKTEYISCPSCGRTLFDLEETTKRIQKRTAHLKGVKIAIMGCIVNGPGEMADADFGYVGAGPGKVHLYREKQLVKTNVPAEEADEELLKLIQQSNLSKKET